MALSSMRRAVPVLSSSAISAVSGRNLQRNTLNIASSLIPWCQSRCTCD